MTPLSAKTSIFTKIPMTFETFNKEKHTLEVGTKIRLAGREGVIESHYPVNVKSPQIIRWHDGRTLNCDLASFPLVEIAVSPLTIDKRVKADIFSLVESITVDIAVKFGGDTWESVDELNRYLNSLEET